MTNINANTNWYLEKIEREQKVEKEKINADILVFSNDLKMKENESLNGKDLRGFSNILIEFNEFNHTFKSFILKKIGIQEIKISQIEHNFKKKIEELGYQVRLHIPIKFNAYVKEHSTNEKMPLIDPLKSIDMGDIKASERFLNAKISSSPRHKNTMSSGNDHKFLLTPKTTSSFNA